MDIFMVLQLMDLIFHAYKLTDKQYTLITIMRYNGPNKETGTLCLCVIIVFVS